LPKVSVVQVAGWLAELEFPQNSVDLVYRMAAAGHGTAYPIFLPMWVEDPSLVERLRTEPAVAQVLDWYDRIDVLVVGIGSWNPPVSCLHNSFSKAWRQQVLAAGVRADLCSTLIDDAGQVVSSPLDQVGLALNTKQLRRIPEIVGIAGGLEKATAILAALRGNWITTLVTDTGVQAAAALHGGSTAKIALGWAPDLELAAEPNLDFPREAIRERYRTAVDDQFGKDQSEIR
jgi:DNA-binding transcriptional regulator LsrR (DeoR family)